MAPKNCNGSRRGTNQSCLMVGIRHSFWPFMILITVLLLQCIAASNGTEKELVEHILSDYNPLVRSRKDVSVPVEVEMLYVLHSLDEINEQEQYLRTFSWLILYWSDDYLKWDPSDYGNITSLNLPSKLIWRPEIVVQNSLGIMYSEITNQDGEFQATVWYDGNIELLTAGPLKTGCDIVTAYFPFDSQACRLVFDSWSFDTTKVTLTSALLDFTHYRRNGAWELVGNDSEIVRYDAVGHIRRSFEYVVYTLYVDRKPLYYMTNIVIPCAALSLLVPLVFLLPPDAGEKISLSITLLLSFTLFLLLISEHMPVTSDYSPVLAMYAVCSLVLACFSLVCTLLVLRLHHNCGETRVPALLRRITNYFLCVPNHATSPRADSSIQPLLASNGRPESDHQMFPLEREPKESRTSMNVLCSLVKEGLALLKDSQAKRLDDEIKQARGEEWLQLAKFMDRIFLILFLLAEVIVLIVFVGIFPHAGHGRV